MRHYILVFISDPYKEYISRLISMKREKSCSFNCKKRNYLYHPFEKKSKLYYTVQVRRTIIKGLLRNIVLTFTGGTLYLISSFLLPKWRLSKKKKNWSKLRIKVFGHLHSYIPFYCHAQLCCISSSISSWLGWEFRSICPALGSPFSSRALLRLSSFDEWLVSPLDAAPLVSDSSLWWWTWSFWAASASRWCWRFFLRIISVLNRRFTVSHARQVHVGLCVPFPLGGWMHTIQVHPGRCLGCFVVTPADDDSTGSTRLPPKTAALARASKREGSWSWIDLLLSSIFRFLESGEDHAQVENLRINYILIIKDKYNTKVVLNKLN